MISSSQRRGRTRLTSEVVLECVVWTLCIGRGLVVEVRTGLLGPLAVEVDIGISVVDGGVGEGRTAVSAGS